MSSPPLGDGVLSSSPVSSRGGLPMRRRTSVSVSSTDDLGPRLSPSLTRSFNPNDPEVRERQRTLDEDMARQLSLARRDTISSPPTSSSYAVPSQNRPTELATFPELSAEEQHAIELARGDPLPPSGDPMDDGIAIDIDRPSNPLNFFSHHHAMHDPSLLVTAGQSRPSSTTEVERPPPTNFQPDVIRSEFDYTKLEEFAAKERETHAATAQYTTPSAVAFQLQRHDDQQDGADVGNERSRSRGRRLSQSTPGHRPHRKGIGGKMAMFEGTPGEPPPSLNDRLGVDFARSQSQPLNEKSEGAADYFSSVPNAHSAGSPGAAGILHTGHNRPYRFSFYSNALSGTIHARSLFELPAEGQTFEQLFTGAQHNGHAPDGDHRPPENTPGRKWPSTGSAFATQPNSLKPDQKVHPAGSSPYGTSYFDGNTWWLDVLDPTDEEMKMLSKTFSIHPLTTEDIQMEETREKIELFRNYYLVCFRSFDQDPYSPTHLEPLNMYVIVFREGVLSFHFRPTPHPQNVRRRIKHLKDYISVTSDWISYALIDDITDAFAPLIQSIEYEVDSIDELVLILKEAEQSDMLRRIGTCRKKVMGLLRLMGNKADVVKGLAKRCNENWRVAPTSDIGLYLSDIQDHLITMTQNLNHYEKILSRSHSNYLAQISIEMTDANNQINDVLSKLTALGTVLIPMNLVTGLWGMNVHVPGQNIEGFAWFISIVACLAAFGIIGGYSTYRFMVRRRASA